MYPTPRSARRRIAAGLPLVCFVCFAGFAGSSALAQTAGHPTPDLSGLEELALEVHPGEPIDPALFGPGVIETMEQALERDRQRPLGHLDQRKDWRELPGVWVTPTRRSVGTPHSGTLHLLNKNGDLQMGIGFPTPVDLRGVWVGGQSDAGAWPPAVRAVGFRDGIETGATEWFRDVGSEARWFEIGLEKIDRVVFEAQPAAEGHAWYSLDDLTYEVVFEGGPARVVVLDFEDLGFRYQLTGSGYAGLVWESGAGAAQDDGVHAPERPRGLDDDPDFREQGAAPQGGFLGGSGTLPDLVSDFQTIKKGDNGSSTYPPDTCGSVGPDHFVEVINRVFAVYDKATGQKLLGMYLGNFLPNSNGDPRVHYDPHSGRWIVMVTDFSTRIYLAVSTTSDPTGSWFKTNFVISTGSDSGCWPDYPTLGVDANGVYVGAYMVNCGSMSLFVVDKAPLVAPSPSLGTVTAFRNLSYEGALQPCKTWGDPGAEYVVSTRSTNQIRIRRVVGPMTSPTLTTVANVTVGTHFDPPNAPALGSSVNINTVDDRLMNAVYRDGSIWCGHTVSQSGRAACRWYELGTGPFNLIQSGTISDGSLHYYFPGLAVNEAGNVVVGFSGSNSSQYVGAYYTGRVDGDPPGEMAVPVQFRAGQAAQNNIDGFGRNRWGDYSLGSADPDGVRLWTIQEYAHANNVWGTHVAEVSFDPSDTCPDPTSYCVTSPNSVGPGMIMSWTGTPSVSDQDLALWALAGPSNQLGIFYYGENQIQAPFGDGFRCVDAGLAGIFRLPVVQMDAFGDATYPIEWDQPPVDSGPGALLPGTIWNFQFWYRDPAAGGAGFNLSDALTIVFCP